MNFFTSIVQIYIPSVTNAVLDLTNLRNFVKSKIEPSDMFTIPIMSEDQVLKFRGVLDETKTTGKDGVSAKLLKMAAHVLAKPLTDILNLIIKTNQFPTQWKTGKVTPIHKSGNRSDQNNFRTITILCTLIKILERHIHDSLYNFLIKNSLLYLAQSGFRDLHSCETALSRLVDIWTSNMEKGLLNGIIFLDLRKAFDLVDTDILLKKLSLYQCDKNTIDWLKSYLQNREQCVQFKGKISDTIPVTHGVPQVSILGPLPFIVFMNDLPLHVD